jgi:TPR repeat protein
MASVSTFHLHEYHHKIVTAMAVTATIAATGYELYVDSDFMATTTTTICDANCNPSPPGESSTDQPQSSTSKQRFTRLSRKRTTLSVATACTDSSLQQQSNKGGGGGGGGLLQRFSTQQELQKLRSQEKEMLKRWEMDEEGWRDLPARAWPAYQPNPEQLKGILAEITINNCNVTAANNKEDLEEYPDLEDETLKLCTELLFDMATSFVFYNVNPPAGLAQYELLAKHGHVDSMVACGVILVEGLGVAPREKEGLAWLEKAVEKGSAQAQYELGTVYYTGIDGVVEEDVEKAFVLFEKAAAQNHTAAIYMVADCLVEGEGTEKSVARAIPLFYKAAERGHRFSRQRIRELLARLDYPL